MNNAIKHHTDKGYNIYTIPTNNRGNIFNVSLMVRPDNTEEVIIRKVTNNPYGTVGKSFKSFDDAMSNYKAAEFKASILLAADSIMNYRVNAELARLAANN